MNNERNLTSESCPWNNKQGLGQQVLQRHQKAVRQPLSPFASVPKRLGYDRISLISDIHRRHNSGNFSTLIRSNLPLANFFYLTNQQSQNQNSPLSSTSSSNKDTLQRIHINSQPKGEGLTALKNQDAAADLQIGTKKQQTPDNSHINSSKSQFIPASTLNRKIDTVSGIPATGVRNEVQVPFNGQHTPVQAGDERINRTDAMPSMIETAGHQHEPNVQDYHDNPAKPGGQSLHTEIMPPRLTSLGRAVYRTVSRLSDNRYQSHGLGQQKNSRQNTTIYKKRLSAVQVPGVSKINFSLRQQPIAATKINRIIDVDSGISSTNTHNEFYTPFNDQQAAVHGNHENTAQPIGQPLQTRIAPTNFTSLDRAINRTANQLPDTLYQSNNIGQQSSSGQNTTIFRKRLDVAQMSKSSATNVSLLQQPKIVPTKINRILDTDPGISAVSTRSEIQSPLINQQYESTSSNIQAYADSLLPGGHHSPQTENASAKLTSVDRAINRTATQLPDNTYQSQSLGQQVRSRENSTIFRKRFDAQVPESFVKNVSHWQQPIAATTINRTVDSDSRAPASSARNEVQSPFNHQQTIEHGYHDNTAQPGDKSLQAGNESSNLTSLDRAINRTVTHLTDTSFHHQNLGQQVNNRQHTIIFRKRLEAAQMPESTATNVSLWHQPIAATIINRTVDADSGTAASSARNEVQTPYNDQQTIEHGFHDNTAQPDDQSLQTGIEPSNLTSLDRAINRTATQLQDTSFQSQNIGQQNRSRQNMTIFRKRLDPTQLPESSVTNFSLWQQPTAGTNTAIPATIVQNELQAPLNNRQTNEQSYPAKTDKSDDLQLQTEIAPSKLSFLDRAVNRSFTPLANNTNKNKRLAQQVQSRQHAIVYRKRLDASQLPESSIRNISHWQQPLAGTMLNRTVDTSTGITTSTVQSEVQAPFNKQQAHVQRYPEFTANPGGHQPLHSDIALSSTTSLNRAINRTDTQMPDNTNQSQGLGQQILSRQNAIIFRKRLEAGQMPENSESNVSPWQLPTATTKINRAVDTDSGTLAASAENEVNAPMIENAAEKSTSALINNGAVGNRAENFSMITRQAQNTTPLSVVHRHLSPNLFRRSIATHRFNHQNDMVARQMLRNDLPNKVSSASIPVLSNTDSISAQRAIPNMIQKKLSAEFDSGLDEMMSKNHAMQLPLAGNFNGQGTTSQPVVQKEENTNVLYRQEAADFNPESFLADAAPDSETEEVNTDEPEAKQPSTDELVDKVWRKLMRKLVVEQERIGGSAKWL